MNYWKNISLSKKILSAAAVLLILIICTYFELITYGIGQGVGQFNIIWNARPVAELLADPKFPDSLKTKLKLVAEIRQFAFDSLGINYSDNYTTIYDQKNKPVLWVVTASEPYALKSKEWTFPFLGTVAYKGFFEQNKALAEAKILKEQGLETSIDEVAGWSTLGWFQDPILSNMLKRYPGSLANLIIHELTHGTLFIKNNVDFNENLASFVGDKGAEMFLKHKYGIQSAELAKYIRRKKFNKEYSALVLEQSRSLDSIYKHFSVKTSLIKKEKIKKVFYKKSIGELVILYQTHNVYYQGLREDLNKINNTFYMDEKRYKEKQNFFEEEFTTKFNSDFKAYFQYLKKKYPSL